MNASYQSNVINVLNLTAIYIFKYILTTIYIIGNLGTLFSFFIFCQKSWRKNVCVFYFKCSLFFNFCYLNSTVLGIVMMNGFDVQLINYNIILCKFFYYACFLFAILPPTILILASIDRLLISSQNIDTRMYSSKRLAYFSISIAIIFWCLFNIHAFIMVNIHQISPDIFLCSFNQPKVYYDFISYFTGTLNIIFCAVMTILCILAFKNVRKILTFPSRQRNGMRSMTKKDFQLLRCLYAEDIIFIIFSTLVVAIYIYEAVTTHMLRTELQNTIRRFLKNVIIFLFNTSYSCNFLIFFIVSKAFRNETKRIFRLTSQLNQDEKNEGIVVITVNAIQLPN